MLNFRRFAFLLGSGFVLASCAVGPDFESPKSPKTESYTESKLPDQTIETTGEGGEAQRFLKGKEIPACWWHLFHSKPLNKLIEKALQNNPTLQAAQSSLHQAEANLQVSTASLFPFIYLQAFPERQRFNPAVFGVATPANTFNLYNATVNVSYTLDIFGGIRRQIEAAEAEVDYQKYQTEAAYLTLTANIVTAAISEASLRDQIQATYELITAQERTLDLTKNKLKIGASSQLEVLAQEAQLSQLKATLPPLENELAKIRHGLAVLVGDFPSESCLPSFRLSDFVLPTDLPVSLPSKLVCQRPDIKAAEALLHNASAQIGVATANLFPQVTLTGSYGFLSDRLNTLFTHNSNVWTALANLIQPVFQGGALIGKREQAKAAFEGAYAQYRQTVLQGFQNVADTLRALDLDAQQLHIQTRGEEAALKTLNLTRAQYSLGAISYLNLLDAEKQYHQARIGRIQALTARYADTAALFQALGGGWWNR